jgi:hypothetical protein
MITLFVGDLQLSATKFLISSILEQVGPIKNFKIKKHSKKTSKIAFFDVSVASLEKFLSKPIFFENVEHYAQLSQNQQQITLEVLKIQKRRICIEKLPAGLKDQDLENFFKQIFGEKKILSFFSVKSKNHRHKGYGFLHVTEKKFAYELLKLKKIKFHRRTIYFRAFKQKYKPGVMNQIKKLKENQKSSKQKIPLKNFKLAEISTKKKIANNHIKCKENIFHNLDESKEKGMKRKFGQVVHFELEVQKRNFIGMENGEFFHQYRVGNSDPQYVQKRVIEFDSNVLEQVKFVMILIMTVMEK